VVLQVIVDTNFLMVPASFKVDIFKELDRVLESKYELLVPQPVIKELERLRSQGSPRERAAANVALELSKRMKIVPAEGKTDDVILQLAEQKGVLVATNDSVLRRKLRKRGIPVIFLRERSHLMIDGLRG